MIWYIISMVCLVILFIMIILQHIQDRKFGRTPGDKWCKKCLGWHNVYDKCNRT